MFRLNTTNQNDVTFYIQDDKVWKQFLHSDGSTYRTVEYFPTEKQAQAVLDKFQPKHKWVHGDVFRRKSGTVMVYLVIDGMGPVVYLLNYSSPGPGITNACLKDATFLFNIKSAAEDWPDA